MPSLQQVAAASALLGLVAAAPVQEKRAQPFSVKQVANPNFTKPSPKSAYYRGINKWAPRMGKAGISGGSVSATPVQGDVEYLCPVTIGSQKFTLDFDTGSSDTWVLGPDVSGASSHTTYKGSGKKQSGSSWKIQYGDGSSASGDVYIDTIDVGGTSVSDQAIEVATQAADSFTSGAEDGLLGLAFDSINTVSPKPVKTFMTNAIDAGLDPVFTADLKPGAPGTYDFGTVDKSKYSGDITYVDVDDSQGFWAFSPEDGDAGIADTGTTLIYIGSESVQQYYSQVKSAQAADDGAGGSLYVFDCSEELPDFSITVGGYKATVPGKDINMGDDGQGQCLGGIQDDGAIGQAIYGDVFLKSQFVVFDVGTQGGPRLGFAKKA